MDTHLPKLEVREPLVWLVRSSGHPEKYGVEPFSGGEVLDPLFSPVRAAFSSEADADSFARIAEQSAAGRSSEPSGTFAFDNFPSEPIAWFAVQVVAGLQDAPELVYYVSPTYEGAVRFPNDDRDVVGVFPSRDAAEAFIASMDNEEPPEIPGQCTSRDPENGRRCVKSAAYQGQPHGGPHVGWRGGEWSDEITL